MSLFTSMFLHGGWMHLLGNMLFLWVFGDNIEAALGHLGFILFYIIGGLAASVAHVLFSLGSEIPSVGASGAISACLGAYLIMFPSSKVRTIIPLGFFFIFPRISAWIFLGIWILIQLFSGTSAEVDFRKIPQLPDVEYYISQKAVPGGTNRNWASYGEKVFLDNEIYRNILADPQTSGGLLISVSENAVEEVKALLRKFSFKQALDPIGKMVAGKSGHIVSVQ